MSSKPIFNTGTERFVRDWRSAVVTVTVRDQRYRQHDPILGIVPLKLSDLFQTSSQVTRWYPLDGGIGFGRIRISLLFRHVETKLPPQMMGWDVGTFEFAGDKVVARNYNHQAKIRMRTGGSTGMISRRAGHSDGSDVVYDMSDKAFRDSLRMPVKYRYRSPVVFELHNPGKPGPAGYAILWLQCLVDNEDTDIDIPIWTTKKGARLTQNYITEQNWRAKEVPGLEDLTEVGRLQFHCRFSPGIDESHERFVVDNDSRETFESWEACMAQGVRSRSVSIELPPEAEQKHEQSLVDSRHVLKQASPAERRRWIDRSGHDWSGAFGEDPRAYTDSAGRKVAEPGQDRPRHDPVTPPPLRGQPSREQNAQKEDRAAEDDDTTSTGESEDSERRALSEQPTALTSSTQASQGGGSRETNKANRRSEQRLQRGLMQWRPARNAVFVKDETKFAIRKLKKKIPGAGLTGREPDVETET